MNTVVPMLGSPVRSLVEERAMRPPVIGRIRPGIKVLTSKARANQEAVRLYETMVAAGDSFETIGKAIESRCQLRNALAPKNVDYFTCRRSDFNNPDVADEILKLYGEDRGQGSGERYANEITSPLDGRLKVFQCLGVLDGHAKQCLRRAGRVAASLLPLLIGAYGNAEQAGEFGLRHANLGAGDGCFRWLNAGHAPRNARLHFADSLKQVRVELFLFLIHCRLPHEVG